MRISPRNLRASQAGRQASAAVRRKTAHPCLHRIHAVRKQQGVSVRIAARRMNMKIDQLKNQEKETSDMLLTTLYQWQKTLEVPVVELLVESEGPLSEPVLKRARMLRLMKTAAAILENASSKPLEGLAKLLVNQLVEIMPELKDVSPWHTIGQQRSGGDVGRLAENPLPESMFHEVGMISR